MAQSPKFVRNAVAGVAGVAMATAGFVAPSAFAEVRADGAIIAPTPQDGITQINVLSYNDFHGRLSAVEGFSAALLAGQDAFGAGSTLLVGNGDQIGASEFESAIQQDQPTIDVLTALGDQQTFTAGNHEFDASFNDALDRVSPQLPNGLLAANVEYKDGSGNPFPTHAVFEIDGVSVAVIGAVTQATAALVSPDGIAAIEFTDPVAAVNAVAAQLSDGDAANGEADIIIASYHEGGPLSNAPIDENLANATFASLVNDTAAEVDAIFTAHTHRLYAYDAPNGESTRPVLQANEYGTYVGQVVFDVDAAGGVVATETSLIPTHTKVDGKQVPIFTKDDLSAESALVYDKIVGIKADAYAKADVLGAEVIGYLDTATSRGAGFWADGAMTGQDDRSQESALGGILADSMNVWAQQNTSIGSDLSIMNPGGIRSGLDAENGEITYKDAATVLPFTNNLTIVELTGASLKSVLENQWQRNADGTVPSRAYLQLGVSSNVTYTYDASQPEGSRITGITINGEPIDLDAVYKVTMPAFLAGGGDNFHAINEAVAKHDTGWTDLEAFKQYLASLPDKKLEIDEQRNGFEVVGYFAEAGAEGAFPAAPQVEQGVDFDLTVNDVDLHSLGFIANTEVVATIDGVEVGTAAVEGLTANGEITTAALTINVPATVAPGDYTLTLTANPSGATVQLPITVLAGAVAEQPTLVVKPESATGDESTEGFSYLGTGWSPDSDVTVTVTLPGGAIEQLATVTPEADGTFSGSITWATYDAETGELIADNQEFPAGTYTVTATQGDTVVEAMFTVGETTDGGSTDGGSTDDGKTDGATPVPTDQGGSKGDKLAVTGGDSTLLIGGLALALLLAAGGAALVARRTEA